LKMDATKLICSILFSAGVVALAFSINYASSILAFIGLGLVCWAAILFYIRPEKYVKETLLDKTTLSLLANLEKILKQFDYKSKGVYLPPKYLKDFESSLIFIPSKAEQTLPTPEEVEEEKLYSKNPNGVYLTPPGLALSKLFEKELGTSFIRVDLSYIREKLPRLFIEDMEIAENTEIKTENKTITIEITNHVFNEICQETRKLQKTHESIGCPLCSAIACALAKATGKPIKIEKEEQSQDGKTTRIQFNLLEE